MAFEFIHCDCMRWLLSKFPLLTIFTIINCAIASATWWMHGAHMIKCTIKWQANDVMWDRRRKRENHIGKMIGMMCINTYFCNYYYIFFLFFYFGHLCEWGWHEQLQWIFFLLRPSIGLLIPYLWWRTIAFHSETFSSLCFAFLPSSHCMLACLHACNTDFFFVFKERDGEIRMIIMEKDGWDAPSS